MAKTSPETHCWHVGRGGPDANGKTKCSPADCAAAPSPTETAAAGAEPAGGECALATQADVEMRLASALPFCLGALGAAGACPSECRHALRQFAVGEHLAATCRCSAATRAAPLSALLAAAGVDTGAVLQNCFPAELAAAGPSCAALPVAAACQRGAYRPLAVMRVYQGAPQGGCTPVCRRCS
jgi:hypothetical protein